RGSKIIAALLLPPRRRSLAPSASNQTTRLRYCRIGVQRSQAPASHRLRRLLCPYCKRPSARRAAEQRDELAASWREGRAFHRTPRTEPYVRLPAYGSHLGCVTAKVAGYALARLSHEPGSWSSTCCAGAYFP